MRTSGIFLRTTILLMVLALVPAVIIGFVQMRITQSALESDFEVIKSRLAERTSKSASNFIRDTVGFLSTIGELEEISRFRREEYTAVMRHVLEGQPAIAELDLYDARGAWIFGVEKVPGSIGQEHRLAQMLPYVQDTVKQIGSFRGNVVKVSGYPGLELFVPVRRRSDHLVAGYLRGVISLRQLSESLSETKFGKTSEFFIVDFKNRLIAHSNYKKMFTEGSSEQLDPAITDKISRLGAYLGWSGRLDLKDKRQVILALHKVEDQPWVAGTLQERWEAFVVMIAMRQKLAEVLLVGGVAVLIAALIFAGRISSPVRSLTQAVRQIAAGDFTKPVTEPLPKPNDEIGELASAFETMSRVLANRTHELMRAQEDLKRFNLELEARVDARTRELKATQDELIKQERLAAIGQMASVVGHELRNPLSVINNSIYVIRNRLGGSPGNGDAAIDPKIIRHVTIIEGELNVANQIISEILTFARTREIQIRDLELHELLEEICGRLAAPPGINIEKHYVQNPVTVKMDPDEVRQAVRNLIINAFDVLPNGGRVEISTRIEKDGCIISVSDSGPGIPPDVQAKIFTPFFTTKSKGTGLGLAVVKKVMDRHNGEVTVESVIGKGTTFHLKFPVG
ncbi:MAG: HAMP domain-containing protein [Elusimicrobia bacterium]|nr:HAMP domain-containing protein [Elusimicrobiota bacterium]